MWIRSFWDVFQIMHMDNFTFCYQTSLKHYVFRARTCTHCISRRHLLCSVLLQQRNLRNSYAHFAIETEKEKTVRMKRKGDMKGQKHRESLYWVCHLVCSSTSPCYCAPIFRSQSRAGLYRAQGRVSSNHIRLHDTNTEPLRKSEWNQQGQVYEDGPCNIYVADRVISAFDWIWRDMNLTGGYGGTLL